MLSMQMKYSLSPTAPAGPAYEFTTDWFSYNIPVWEPLLAQLQARRMLEIGAFEGRSCCHLIERCGRERPVEIHCVDTWAGGVEHAAGTHAVGDMSDVERRFDRNVAIAASRVPHRADVVKHKMLSGDALIGLLAVPENAASFDLVYVDGSHQAPDVLQDAVLAFRLLRVGGLIVFDDYLWSMEAQGSQDPLNMPKPAIDAFLNIYQRKVKIVRGPPLYQIYAHKTAA